MLQSLLIRGSSGRQQADKLACGVPQVNRGGGVMILPCKWKCQLCACGASDLEKVNKDPKEADVTHCGSMLIIGIWEVIACLQGSRF